MKTLTRRSFVEAAGLGLAALSTVAGTVPTASAQLVYRAGDWNVREFEKLVKQPGRAKQVYDIRAIGDGKFLNNIKNSLNGLSFGFGIPKEDIKIVAALHGPSNMLNFNDDAWKKYQIGEWLRLKDPSTGAPAVRNIYLARKSSGSSNPDDPASIYQDISIEALQARGVTFLSCHSATEEQVRTLAKERALKEPVEDIVRDLQAQIVPGALIVPAMVAAISLLQSEGRFTYITA